MRALVFMAAWSVAAMAAAQDHSVVLTANGLSGVTVPAEAYVMLRWETDGDPTNCRASGDWSGAKDKDRGQERSKFLVGPATFTLECRKAGVVTSDTVEVNVSHRSFEGDVTLLQTEACDPIDEGDCLRHDFEVTCNDLAPRTAEVWEYDALLPETLGAMVFSVGGEGKGRYGGDGGERDATVQALREAGFQVFSIGWTSETGWQVEGAGLSEPMCGYSQIVRWLHEFLIERPDVVCAQGNSGGSMQIVYGIELYRLDEIFDMVIPTAGPNYSRMDSFCFDPEYPAYGGPSKGGSVDFFNGWETWRWCERSVGEDWHAKVLDKQSLLADLQHRRLHYPRTKVNAIVSEGDPTWDRASVWFDAVSSEKANFFIEGSMHGVDRTAEGAAKIRELVLTECFDRSQAEPNR